MKIRFAIVCALAWAGQAAAQSSPLFDSGEVLELTLVADFAALEGDRGEVSPRRPAVLWTASADGAAVGLEVTVRTRGNFRLRRSTCAFPNLRIDFGEGAGATAFAGQDALKLVAHCRNTDDYEQNALEEYLAYRLYNLVSDASFRVRLARFVYADVNGASAPVSRLGFLVEDLDAVAARLGGIAFQSREVNPLLLDPEATARLELFQYMIGNTDFSIVFSHNSELLRLPEGPYRSIPYDFDFAGLVDSPYATPDASLGTRSVRERVYRGFCRREVAMEEIYEFFRERRAAFAAAVREVPALDVEGQERAVGYLDEFFDVVASPRARRDLIERQCRTVPG